MTKNDQHISLADGLWISPEGFREPTKPEKEAYWATVDQGWLHYTICPDGTHRFDTNDAKKAIGTAEKILAIARAKPDEPVLIVQRNNQPMKEYPGTVKDVFERAIFRNPVKNPTCTWAYSHPSNRMGKD